MWTVQCNSHTQIEWDAGYRSWKIHELTEILFCKFYLFLSVTVSAHNSATSGMRQGTNKSQPFEKSSVWKLPTWSTGGMCWPLKPGLQIDTPQIKLGMHRARYMQTTTPDLHLTDFFLGHWSTWKWVVLINVINKTQQRHVIICGSDIRASILSNRVLSVPARPFFCCGGGGNIPLGHLEVNAQSQWCLSLVNHNEYRHVHAGARERFFSWGGGAKMLRCLVIAKI